MPINILMPALSPTMEKGNLAKWLKKEGDAVKAGDVLAEIETDKATMEFEAVDEGTLGKILVPEGTQDVAINAPIAVLLEEGEDKSAIDGRRAAASPSAGPSPAASGPPSPARGEGSPAAAAAKASPATPTATAAATPSPPAGEGGARSAPGEGRRPPTVPAAASSRRRSPDGWPRKPASTFLRSRAPARMAAW